MKATAKVALVVVDVQKDFCPGGALAVKGADAIVPRLNRVVRLFADRSLPVFFSRDWHPPNHCSFTGRGGQWPPHCVRGTTGAEFHDGLLIPPGSTVISKATKPEEEAYSAFGGTGLAEELRKTGVTELVVGGLATDYCVKNTVLDGAERGFETYVVTDCVRGVDVEPSDSAKALREMSSRGAKRTTSARLLREMGTRGVWSSS